MSGHVPMGPGAEFDALRTLLGQWGDVAKHIGDDAAVLDVPPGSRLVVSTDASVEDVHFRQAWLTAEEIGWRATQAALSDLAAMGAAPLGVLVALTVPRRWRGALSLLGSGIGAAARAQASPILGGDVTDGDRLALVVTVLGVSPRPLSRAGARPGDTLYVTGALGGPGAALAAWLRGAEPEAAHRTRFAAPEARLAASQWLAAHGATAAIDLSDGLVGDARHLAAASGVVGVIEVDRVPCIRGVAAEAALTSGEEYELLVAAPALDAEAFRRAHGGLALTAIGRVEAAMAGGALRLLRDGAPVAPPGGFDHFAQ